MCGRFVLNADTQRILKEFDALLLEPYEFSPRFNIAPTQIVPVIISDENGHRILRGMRWGLIPSWAKDDSLASRLINARSETIAEKPSFRSAFRSRRCLVPATGFYEWKSENKVKTPVLIEVAKRPLFSMAGLWESWEARDESGAKTGEIIDTFTILTTDANQELKSVHDRMPRILDRKQEKLWIDPYSDSAKLLEWTTVPYTERSFELRPVSRRVNSPQNEGAELIRPLRGSSSGSQGAD